MFDNNDYINSLLGNLSSSSTTTTEETQEQQNTTFSPQTDYNSNPYERDDYSTTQNFTEQQSYNSSNVNSFEPVQETRRSEFMNSPMIEKSQKAVNLVKTKSRVRLETRMKIVLSVFSVIMICLLFVSIFNFVKANKLEASFADKQLEINLLKRSISDRENEYIWVNDNDQLRLWAEENGITEDIENFTNVVKLNEMYKEDDIQDLESNWFNDVCEFFSKLFA